tara:strand:+ start:642 stop:1187 length:546 start_codon:yes stop_codon:yes gene_type:complete
VKLYINIKVKNEAFDSESPTFDRYNNNDHLKYVSGYSFETIKDVISVKESRESTINIPLIINDEDNKKTFMVNIRNVTKLVFESDDELGIPKKYNVIISNDLIDEFHVTSKKKNKIYHYFYLKESCKYYTIGPNVWISQSMMNSELERIAELIEGPIVSWSADNKFNHFKMMQSIGSIKRN